MWCSVFFVSCRLFEKKQKLMPGSKWQAAGERRERVDSYEAGFQNTKLSRTSHTELRPSLPACRGGGICSAKTMLLVFGDEGGDSFRNHDQREVAAIKSNLYLYTYSTQHHQRFRNRYQFSEPPRWLKHHTHNTSPSRRVRRQHEQ